MAVEEGRVYQVAVVYEGHVPQTPKKFDFIQVNVAKDVRANISVNRRE